MMQCPTPPPNKKVIIWKILAQHMLCSRHQDELVSAGWELGKRQALNRQLLSWVPSAKKENTGRPAEEGVTKTSPGLSFSKPSHFKNHVHMNRCNLTPFWPVFFSLQARPRVVIQGWEHIGPLHATGAEADGAVHWNAGGGQLMECGWGVRIPLTVLLADAFGIHIPLSSTGKKKIKQCLSNLCIEDFWKVWEHRMHLCSNSWLLHLQMRCLIVICFNPQTPFQVKFF